MAKSKFTNNFAAGVVTSESWYDNTDINNFAPNKEFSLKLLKHHFPKKVGIDGLRSFAGYSTILTKGPASHTLSYFAVGINDYLDFYVEQPTTYYGRHRDEIEAKYNN